MISRFAVTVANVPARNEFGFGINRRPSPDVATALLALGGGDVLFFAPDERPNFVALDTLAGQVAESLVLKFGTSFAQIGQELHDRRAMNASHASRGAEGITLAKQATTRMRSSVEILFMSSK